MERRDERIPTIQPSWPASCRRSCTAARSREVPGRRAHSNFFVIQRPGRDRPGTRFLGRSTTARATADPVLLSHPAGWPELRPGSGHHRGGDVNGTQNSSIRPDVASPGHALRRDDLALLKYVQSADTMTLTHPAIGAPTDPHRPRGWALAPLPRPWRRPAWRRGSAAAVVVTAITTTGEESLPTARLPPPAPAEWPDGTRWRLQRLQRLQEERLSTASSRWSRRNGPTTTSGPTSPTRRPAPHPFGTQLPPAHHPGGGSNSPSGG